MALTPGGREYVAVVGGRQRRVRVEPEGERLRIRVDEEEFVVDCETAVGGEVCLLLNGRPHVLHVEEDGPARSRVWLGGVATDVELRDALAARLRSPDTNGGIREAREIEVRAPMPGVVVTVHAKVGETVPAEGLLVVLEAMKMQNALTSPARATVRRVAVEAGQVVEGGATLVVLDRLEDASGAAP
jgi:glutaconyl-CoA/methylmalonyl-CoA decarboxylase subunit gamma